MLSSLHNHNETSWHRWPADVVKTGLRLVKSNQIWEAIVNAPWRGLLFGPDRLPMQAALESGHFMQALQKFFFCCSHGTISIGNLDRSLAEDEKDLP